MPYVATNAIAFAQRQIGRYRDGECWTLVEDAVVGAGGRSSRGQTPNFGPNASYVWGTLGSITGLQAGDVLQFTRYDWLRETTVDVTNPDGSGSVNTTTQQETRGVPNHTALVVRVVSAGIVDVIEQNIPPVTGGVQTLQIVLAAPAPRVTTTTVAGSGGNTVTVTRFTDRVLNAPRCYRPINA